MAEKTQPKQHAKSAVKPQSNAVKPRDKAKATSQNPAPSKAGKGTLPPKDARKGAGMRVTLVTRLILSLALVMLLMLTISGIFNVNQSKDTLEAFGEAQIQRQEERFESQVERETERLQRNLKQKLNILALFMEGPLWNVDEEQGRSAVESVIADEDIVGIHVIDASGLHFTGLKKQDGKLVPLRKVEELDSKYRRLQRDVKRGGEVIGKVTMVYSEERLMRLQEEAQEEIEAAHDLIKEKVENAAARVSTANIVQAVIFFILIMVCIFMVVQLTIVKPLNVLKRILSDLASAGGDLTKRVVMKSNDEIRDLSEIFNKFLTQIQGIVRSIDNGAQTIRNENVELDHAIKSVANTIHGLTELATNQSAAIEQTSASMREIQSGVELTARYAKDADNLSHLADNESQDGSKAVEQMQQSMQRIQDTAQQINNFISAINEIANQTNLLSLNAAIEAAKAGEQGKGFAVVADEVRRLAENSAKVTQEIQSLIQESNQRINEGQGAVKMVDDSLKRISEKIKQNTELVSQISTATSEQNIALQEISVTLERLAESSSEVAEAAETIDGATHKQVKFSQSTSQHAHQLISQVKRFKF